MDEKETLGKYLKEQRESKKISLREVAKNTRVREHILMAIEEDQHNLLPSATYVRGFLLAYAKYLKLDPNDVLLRYEKVLKGEPVSPPPAQPPKPKQKGPPTQPSEPKQKALWNTKQTWVVGGVIVASLILFYFFFPYTSKPPMKPETKKPISKIPISKKPVSGKPGVKEKPPIAPSPSVAATTTIPEEKRIAEGKQPLAPSPPIPAKKPLSLQFKAVEETWVSLQVDDQSAKEMTFKTGDGISVQASNQIRIIIGNAGGLDLILNGKRLDKFGKSGEVVTLLFTSQGIEVKRPEKTKPVEKPETLKPIEKQGVFKPSEKPETNEKPKPQSE